MLCRQPEHWVSRRRGTLTCMSNTFDGTERVPKGEASLVSSYRCASCTEMHHGPSLPTNRPSRNVVHNRESSPLRERLQVSMAWLKLSHSNALTRSFAGSGPGALEFLENMTSEMDIPRPWPELDANQERIASASCFGSKCSAGSKSDVRSTYVAKHRERQRSS